MSWYSNSLFSFFTQWVNIRIEWEISLKILLEIFITVVVRILCINSTIYWMYVWELAHMVTGLGSSRFLQGEVPTGNLGGGEADDVRSSLSLKAWEQESWWHSFGPKASSLETQEELMFQFQSDSRRISCPGFEGCQECQEEYFSFFNFGSGS